MIWPCYLKQANMNIYTDIVYTVPVPKYCVQIKQVLPAMEFGKKMSVEKELARMGAVKYNNLVYDESGNFLIYSSLLGIKFVNLATQKVSRLIGQREHLRWVTRGGRGGWGKSGLSPPRL